MVDNTNSNGHIINCSDDKSETIVLGEGEYKKIKNFDPNDSFLERLGKYDKLICALKEGQTAQWFKDGQTNKVYAFITDSSDKIIAGAIIDYSGSQSKSGVLVSDKMSLSLSDPYLDFAEAKRYNGDVKDKEEIKTFLKDKVKDNSQGFEVTKNLSRDAVLDAVNGLASADAKVGGNYKSSGGATDKGSNFIG